MTKMEIRTNVKDTAAQWITESIGNAIQIDDYTYVVPMDKAENGNTIYAKIEISCPNWYNTQRTEAFNLNEKVKAYEAKLSEQAEKAAEKLRKQREKSEKA